jgi:pimeloyl-ACP methyl ester carboxylesterase
MTMTFEQTPVQEAKLPQGTIRYKETGTGDPILLVHGFMVNSLLWRKVVPRLSRDFRVIAPDWPMGAHPVPMAAGTSLDPPGFARLVADFMAALDLRDLTLVGNDTGGVKAMIVSLRPRPAQRLPNTFGWVSKRPIENRILDAWLEPARRDAGVRRDIASLLVGLHPRHTLGAAERFGEFDKPVLIAWAPEDKFFPFEHGERLARDFPNARLERIEDSRTFVSEDQPERTAELIAEFAREPAAART